MKKLIVFVLLIALSFFVVKSEVFAQEESPTPTPTSSYELFYPIVAGKTSGNSLYFLKLTREWFVGKLIFSPLKKSDYYLVLTKKRLVETEKLLNENDVNNAKKTSERMLTNFQKAVDLSKKVSDEKSAGNLKTSLKDNGTRIGDFYMRLIKDQQDSYFGDTYNSFMKEVEKI